MRFPLPILALLAAPHFCAAQALAPDVTFGSNGVVITPFSGYDGRVAGLALQPDRKIVVAGTYNGNQDWLVARYLPSGQLDPAFGVGGIEPFNFGSSYEECFAVAVQPTDSKILLGGQANGDYALLRLLPNGQPDATFSGDGRAQLSFGTGNGSTIRSLLVQPDGKIVATGFAYNGNDFDFAAARFLPNGTPDATFGTGGKVLIPIGLARDQGRAALLQPDGKVVIVGETYSSGTGDPTFSLCRLTAGGVPDAAFGTGGKTITLLQPNSYTIPWAVVRQPDGKLVLGGESNGDVAVARYSATGVLDPSFGTAGFTIHDFSAGSQDKIYAMGLQPNGKIVLAGGGFTLRPNALQDALVVRYTATGALDTSFGTAGSRRAVFGYAGELWGMAFQVDGKPVFAGNSTSSQGGAVGFGLLRLTSAIMGLTDDEAAATLPEAIVSPNPLTETSSLTLRLPQAARVSLEVVDGLGRAVGRPPVVSSLAAGTHELALPATLTPGFYIVRLTLDGRMRALRLVRL